MRRQPGIHYADANYLSDPFDVIGAISLGRATARKMKQNLFCPSFGELLHPEIAALSMAGSPLLVAINALLLKRIRLPGLRRNAPSEPSRRSAT